MRVKQFLSGLAVVVCSLLSTEVHAQTVTANPANLCTPVAGARTCDDTISWDKGSSSYPYFSVWMMIQNQPTGRVNAIAPGQLIACGASADGAGVGSRAMKLLQSSIYTFTLVGSLAPCAVLNTISPPNWLAYTNIFVNPLN